MSTSSAVKPRTMTSSTSWKLRRDCSCRASPFSVMVMRRRRASLPLTLRYTSPLSTMRSKTPLAVEGFTRRWAVTSHWGACLP